MEAVPPECQGVRSQEAGEAWETQKGKENQKIAAFTRPVGPQDYENSR